MCCVDCWLSRCAPFAEIKLFTAPTVSFNERITINNYRLAAGEIKILMQRPHPPENGLIIVVVELIFSSFVSFVVAAKTPKLSLQNRYRWREIVRTEFIDRISSFSTLTFWPFFLWFVSLSLAFRFPFSHSLNCRNDLASHERPLKMDRVTRVTRSLYGPLRRTYAVNFIRNRRHILMHEHRKRRWMYASCVEHFKVAGQGVPMLLLRLDLTLRNWVVALLFLFVALLIRIP